MLSKLQLTIEYTFIDKELLKQALTHRSVKNISNNNNERLEFLGDAVLELASSRFLFLTYENMTEGKMSKLRAALVCEDALAKVARQLDLGQYLDMSRGEENTGGRDRDSIISDAVEAIIGAIYLDSNFEEAEKFILKFILNDIEHKQLFHDSKTALQEIIQGQYQSKDIVYNTIKEYGPEHSKEFDVEVLIMGEKLGMGHGKTKKAAEQEAAYKAILKLQKKEEHQCT